MEFIKNAVAVLSVLLIFFGVVTQLLPKGSFSEAYKTFASVAVVAALILSLKGFKNIDFNFDELKIYDFEADSNLNEDIKRLQTESVKSKIERLILESLEKQNIFNVKVSPVEDISNEGDISINKIEFSCSEQDVLKVNEVIEELGFVAIFIEGEDG